MEKKQTLNNHHPEIRVSAPAIATIDGLKYKVENWSLEGLQIRGFRQKAKIGDCLLIYFSLSFREGINISTDTLIEIVDLSAIEGRLEARFINMTQLEKDLLQQAIDNLLKGEITPIEAPIQGNGTTSKMVSDGVQINPGYGKHLNRFKPKFFLFSLVYLVVGGTLLFYILRALHNSLTQMQIKSAVIAKPIEPIISTRWGTLRQVYVDEGMKVEAGQPLFRINDEEMARFIAENEVRQVDALNRDEIENINALSRNKIENIDTLTQKAELARVEVAEARSVLQKAESLRQQEVEKFESYQAITQNKLTSARARVEALTVQYQAEKNKRDRFLAHLQADAVSQQTFDSISSKFADVAADLTEAKAELQIAETAIDIVQKGNFYNGDNLAGNLPRLTADVRAARDRVQLAALKVSTLEQALQKQKQDLTALQKQKDNLKILVTQKQTLKNSPSCIAKVTQENLSSFVYRAPFSGSVLKVVKSAGNTVNRSETLMLLQSELAEPTVEAYLTQDQAARISIDSQVTVFIPELDKNYQARVVKIDRSGDFLDEVRDQHQLQDSKDKSGYVKLVLLGVDREVKSQLTRGMPVVLNITKKFNLP